MPAISVIMPVYNSEKYLRDAIESVLKQTFTDFELLLIDDGSKDSSGIICDEYASQDSRIRVTHQENTGLCGARNRGLELARGEYIAFADNDDECCPDMLESNYRAAKANNADMVKFGRTTHTLKNGKIYKTDVRDLEKAVYEKEELVEKYLFLKNKDLLNTVWDGLFRATVIRENALHFDTNLRYGGEDMIFCMQIYPYLSKLVMNPGIYYIQNIRNWHSTSAVNNAESVKGYIAVANVDMEVYSHLGLHDEVQRINNISSHYLIPLLLSLNQVKAFSDKQRVAFLQGLEKQKGFQFTMDDSLYAKVKAISNRKAKVARLFLQKKYGLLISLARTYDLLLRFKEKIM